MAERDPFGRLPDENPLAGLGSLSDGSTGQGEAEPVSASWGATDDVTAEPAEQEKRARPAARASDAEAHARAQAQAQASVNAAVRSVGLDPPQVLAAVRRIIRVVRIGVVVVVAVIVAMIALGIAVGDDEPTSETEPAGIPVQPAPPPPPPPASERGSADTPVGLQSRSLLTRRNVRLAMGSLATSGLGRLRSLRIAPERIDVQLVTRAGKLRSVQVTPGGRRRTLSTSGAGFGGLPTMRFADVNTAAPERMARGAAQRLKRPVSRVDYVVLVGAGPQATWTVVMRGGGQFVGDARGRITRRVG